MIELGNYQLLPIFIVSLVVILVASEIGRQVGRRAGGGAVDNISTLEAGILGLLALMIGFTFSIALARFESRAQAVLNEANAIGTTALRARLLPAPYNTEVLKLLRDYVQVRMDITSRVPNATELNTAIARSNALQEALWQRAKAVTAQDKGMVPTGLFIQALNEMIDQHEKRLTAVRNRVPNIVLVALYGIAFVAGAFAGYANGLSKRSPLPVYLMATLICAVILLIQDLDRPSAGFITVSQQPMIDTAASISSYSD